MQRADSHVVSSFTLQITQFIGQIEKDFIYQLLVFCVASTKSYATTVYLRTVDGESIRASLVYSEMRLALLDTKFHWIPNISVKMDESR